MLWSKTVSDKGLVKKGDTVRDSFVYNGDNIIERVTPLCNCLKVSLVNNTVVFIWKINGSKKGPITKLIEVRHKDGNRTYLTIKVNIQ